MIAFINMPTWTDAQAGIAPIVGGFWSSFSPIVFWGGAIVLVCGIILIFFKVAANAIDWANRNWVKNDPMDLANTREMQKKNDNWIKPGSVEDLMNKHYNYSGRQKEIADRKFYQERHKRENIII